MYNKLFTKILDSSVWLESVTTRIVWLTLIAAMDEDGFAAFAAIGNLAGRARVSSADCEKALKVLESPDSESADPDNDGRRIERVPGGWIVLNATKYREMVTRVVSQERTRERVRKHRREKAGNAPVTVSNASVTPSETDTVAVTETHARGETAALARTTNPHAKTTNLINGNELRRHGSHAWCDHDRGLCVPPSLHEDFKKRGMKTDAEMRTWYSSVIVDLGIEPVGDDVFDFWRAAFSHWVGTVAVKATTRKLTKNEESIAASRRVLARLEGRKS